MAKAPARLRRRVRRITGLFAGFVVEFWWLEWRARWLGPDWAAAARRHLYQRQANRFRRRAVELGGLLIKLGQFLSTRVDLLPPQYTDELASLQDQVPAEPFAAVQKVVETELGRPLAEAFPWFEPAAEAAASLGQVHRARTPSGRLVAVKVQRPGIEEIIAADLTAFGTVVRWARRLPQLRQLGDLDGVYREFAEVTTAELDYVAEGHNAQRVAAELADHPWIHVPTIDWDLSRRRVLTMEYVRGTKLTDRPALLAAGLDPPLLARRLVAAYLDMVLVHGFFHADPHPGNIFALPENHLALVDFGMVGSISPQVKREIRNLFVAVAQRDTDAMVAALVRLGLVRPAADLPTLRRDIEWVMQRYWGLSLGEVANLNVAALTGELRGLIRRQPIRIPASVAYLGRAVGTLVGLATGLDPHLNVVELFTPYARQLVSGDGGPLEAVWQRLFADVRAVAELPQLANRALRAWTSGQTTVQVQAPELLAELRRSNATRQALGRQIMAGALMVAAAILWAGHSHLLAAAPAALAILLLLSGRRP